MLMGISCRDEMLMIRNVHISLLAVPAGRFHLYSFSFDFGLSGVSPYDRLRSPDIPQSSSRSSLRQIPPLLSSSSFPSSSIAFNPAGVAAQPSPSIFAIIFVAIYCPAGCPSGRFGKRNLITGRIFFVSASMRPARSPIFKIPHQNDMIPSIVTPRVTASFAESSSPFVTSPIFP